MTVEDVIAALALPPESRVEQRVPKKLLAENGAPTAADKRQINDGIEELFWVAALKPNTVGVPEYRDDAREYLEIAVLMLSIRNGAKAARLIELVHRAIPYPVFLASVQAGKVTISLADKRFSQNERGTVVLDNSPTVCELDEQPFIGEWLTGLALAGQARSDLWALYRSWIARLESFQAAQITGQLAVSVEQEAQDARRAALAAHADLERQIAVLRARATKEKQIGRRVELNLEIKRLESQLGEAKAKL